MKVELLVFTLIALSTSVLWTVHVQECEGVRGLLKDYYFNHSTLVKHYKKRHEYSYENILMSYDQATLHGREFKVWLIILDIKSMKRKEV